MIPFHKAKAWGLGVAVLAALAALALSLVRRSSTAEALPPPPTRVTLPPDTAPVFVDFLGAEACGECHSAEYHAWTQSTHGRAGGPPTAARVIAPFNGRPLRFHDALVTPSVTASGRFVVTVAQHNRPARTFQVDAVVGGGFMAGGGTQTLFSKFPDGTLRLLPFDYSAAEHRWFCQLRANKGWRPVTPEISLADCDAWPPRRYLGRRIEGFSEGYETCQQCHGSQIEIAFDSIAKRYDTRFTSLAINCESCHGPGRRHVELARSGRIGPSGEIGMRSLATLTKDQSLEVCLQCHGVKTALKPGYLPGRPLQDYYALKLSSLLDTVYFADGRTRAFAYQEGHLSSDCYVNGSMTCVDCHDPHTQRYRDVNGSPLEGRLANGQCLGCHPSKAEPLERHTHHGAASPGSRCVSCHMPYLQQPSVGRAIRYARSDHTIPIPRPAYDSRLGLETACRQCHRDHTVADLEAQVTAWYGALKPRAPAVTALIAARDLSDPSAAARTILSAPDRHVWAEFAGLTDVFERYASEAMAALDGETTADLEQPARSPDPDVQALALATLHLARGADPKVRRFLASQLRGLGTRDEIIRDRWAWILRVRGDGYLASGEYERALATFGKAQEVKPGDAAVLRELGVTYTRLQDYARAIEEFRRSLASSPGDPQALVALGFALMQRGDLEGAIAAHRQAIAADPWDPAGYANLGVALLRGGAVGPAVEALEKAVELNPGLADAYFTLASAYDRLGQRERAAVALQRGLEFDPRNQAARRMLEVLRP